MCFSTKKALVSLTPKAFDTLLALVQNNGHVLTTEELMAQVWPDSFVEGNNLAQNISTLRKVLGAGGAKFIETVPKRGYRFVAEVKEIRDEAAAIPFQPEPRFLSSYTSKAADLSAATSLRH